MTPFDGWANFYVIVGSAAGALIGLQFVVMTLIADLPLAPANAQTGDAFATPSVVHFSVVLFLSALACAPWNGIITIAMIWGIVGFVGIVYVGMVTRRLWVQTVYKPVFEDWLFHALLPCVAYIMLAVAACVVFSRTRPAMFIVSAAVLLLLFIGIHNAWDIVTYHVFVKRRQDRQNEQSEQNQ